MYIGPAGVIMRWLRRATCARLAEYSVMANWKSRRRRPPMHSAPLPMSTAVFGVDCERGMVMPTATDTIMAAVPVDEAGIGSSMNDTSREMGFALGVAILGSIVTSIYRSNVTESLADVASSQVVRSVADSLGSLGQVTGRLSPDVASAVTNVANGAFVDAMRIGVLAGIAIVGLTIVIALLTMPSKMRAAQAKFDEESGAKDASIPSATARVLPTEV